MKSLQLRHYVAFFGVISGALLPFLLPFHAPPVPTFYKEWLALVCGLACLPILAGRELAIPRIALLPAGIGMLLLLQCAWLPAGLRAGAFMAALYLLWAVLLSLAVRALIETVGLQRLARSLALALLIAALINAFCVAAYHFGLRGDLLWLSFRPSGVANLAQVNHVADLCWLGISSTLYLYASGGRRGWLVAALPLLLASACTGARAPFAYAVWLVLAAWVGGERHVFRASCVLVLAYAAAVALVYAVPAVDGKADSIARLADSAFYGSGGQVRLGLIATASAIAVANPLFGAGWGSFAWESYRRVVAGMDWQGTGEHAHQLFFQLAAEMGIPAALFAAVLLLLWLRGAWRQRRHLEIGWATMAGGIVLLHAQVEYPLWYAHWLGMAVILLTLSETRVFVLRRLRISRLAVSLLMLTGGYLLVTTVFDYARLEYWLAQDMRRGTATAPKNHYRLLADLHRGSLIQPKASLMIAALMSPTSDRLADKRRICADALRIEPQAPAVFKCALLEELAGEHAKAERDWRLALLVFGAEKQIYLEELKRLPEEDLRPLRRLIAMAEADSPTPAASFP